MSKVIFLFSEILCSKLFYNFNKNTKAAKKLENFRVSMEFFLRWFWAKIFNNYSFNYA